MAKWGEGDPRWIVEERADATNVNNWHWTEKNATSWSKDRIKSLLEGFKIENEKYSCEITEVTKCEGEASANNRKAKLIFFYEWDIKADWKGTSKESDETFKGLIEIPNLSEENEPHEIDVRVTTQEKADEAYKVKEFVRTQGEKPIQNQLGRYITDLKEEYSKGLILPKKCGENVKPKATSGQNEVKSQMNKPVVSQKNDVGVQIRCKRIKEKVKFQCEVSDLYRALTEPERVTAFSRNPVQMEAEKGGSFTMFGGTICGRFQELETDKKIVMQWRQKSWPDEHYSTVTLDLNQTDKGTELTLTQTGVPESEYEQTSEGWKRYYWDAIRQTFGFGANLF